MNNDSDQVLVASGLEKCDVQETLKEKPNDNQKSYATPSIIKYKGQKQLISPVVEDISSYDPKTGEELWRVCHQGWGWNVDYGSGLFF